MVEKHPGLPSNDGLKCAPTSKRNHWSAARHRLERNQAEIVSARKNGRRAPLHQRHKLRVADVANKFNVRAGAALQLSVSRAVPRDHKLVSKRPERVDDKPGPLVRLNETAAEKIVAIMSTVERGTEKIAVNRRMNHDCIAPIGTANLIGDMSRLRDILRNVSCRTAVRSPHHRREHPERSPSRASETKPFGVRIGHRPRESKRAQAVTDLRRFVACPKPVSKCIAQRQEHISCRQATDTGNGRIKRRQKTIVAQKAVVLAEYAVKSIGRTDPLEHIPPPGECPYSGLRIRRGDRAENALGATESLSEVVRNHNIAGGARIRQRSNRSDLHVPIICGIGRLSQTGIRISVAVFPRAVIGSATGPTRDVRPGSARAGASARIAAQIAVDRASL